MAMFKCKMCGGSLEVTEGMTVCECEYCGTSQTVPVLDNEKKQNLFNRANRLRFNSEFDKAASVFESIAAEFPEEPEAYWGLCLCKYGIEYVDDPVTAKKIPTCHRTSTESIFDDGNFEMALEYADVVSKKIYREEAKEIDRLQKKILEIVHNEKPYDIFICYKETGEDGQRTKDSVMAQDIHDALTEKGYKVFFARITLEDKIGQEYEPYIFAALTSARIMLSIGTSYEHFNAVWVKNEWSRFLDMMKSDRSKMLIPCYCDIDAYDMPAEFRNLQGQDMNKIGFIQDLIRGIGKVIVKEQPINAQVIQQVVAPSANVENLLKRGNIALEDKKWTEADGFFEQVLNENVEESRAYLGKLLAEYRVSNEKQLENCTEKFSNSDNYKKAVRFGYAKLEETYKLSVYNVALIKMENSNNDKEYREVKEIFISLETFKDSNQKAHECEEKALDYLYNIAVQCMNNAKQTIDLLSAKDLFVKLGDYKDSKEKALECEQNVSVEGELKIYTETVKLKDEDTEEALKLAIEKFSKIKKYSDSDKLYQYCIKRLEELNEIKFLVEKQRKEYEEICYKQKEEQYALNQPKNIFKRILGKKEEITVNLSLYNNYVEILMKILKLSNCGNEVYILDDSWLVIEKQDDKMLLLLNTPTEYCVYNKSEYTFYSASEIRRYINERISPKIGFLSDYIQTLRIGTSDDKLFILSAIEFNQIAVKNKINSARGTWWLRNKVSNDPVNQSEYVNERLEVLRANITEGKLVRPAMWIKIK